LTAVDRPRRDGDDGYAAMAERMVALAATQPGFLGIESARAGTAVERSYGIELAGERAADELIDRLSRIEGVLAVEVVRAGK
jgi:hypothetical protein